MGLGGIYINRIGREVQGTVAADEVAALKSELIGKLQGLRDEARGQEAIRKVYDTDKVYRGAYKQEAPDLIIGCHPGYRVSWESVTGCIAPEVFSDNTKAWSGDHDVDPRAVPGVIFVNREIKADNPHIADLAPTVLDLFAVPVPGYMEGKVLF